MSIENEKLDKLTLPCYNIHTMKSIKLWHVFALILGYFAAATGIAFGINLSTLPWWLPFAVGVAIWITAIVFFIKRESAAKLGALALPATAIACGLFIGAYVRGVHIKVEFLDLALLAALTAGCFLLLMALLTPNRLNGRVWYQILSLAVWLGASITLCIFVSRALLPDLPKRGVFLLFFLLLLGFFGIGALIESYDFAETCSSLVVPLLVATCLIGVIALLLISGGDGCDCDGGCCDGFDCSGGNHNATQYTKKKQPPTTMSNLSSGL